MRMKGSPRSNSYAGAVTTALPYSRHKARNAGQVFAANRETEISAAKYA